MHSLSRNISLTSKQGCCSLQS
uniref:Uncharacterized protein n=1 Tax=Arundo donax TaxID=35708 RepID=A0A0A9F2V0_ARUDO